MDGQGGNPFEFLLSYVSGSQTDDKEKLREIGRFVSVVLTARGRFLVADGY